MLQWTIWLVVAVIAVYAIFLFNRLVSTRQLAHEAWSGIDVQLKRRSDLIPNLVETVKGYASHERAALNQMTELRNAARAIPDADVEGRAKAEGALSGGLARLFALAESYPDLKASSNFLELQRELSQVENELQMARRYYNGAARNLNTLVETVPSNVIARLFGFRPRGYFELADASERAVPGINLR